MGLISENSNLHKCRIRICRIECMAMQQLIFMQANLLLNVTGHVIKSVQVHLKAITSIMTCVFAQLVKTGTCPYFFH